MLDTAQAGEALGVAPATLAKWRVFGGGPPFVKLGARVLYPARDLEQWLAQRPRHVTTRVTRSGAAA